MKLAEKTLSLLLLLFPITASGQDFPQTIFKEKDFMSSWNFYDAQGMHYAFFYTKGIRFGSNTSGPFELTGHWQGKVFYYTDPAGKGDIETAKILDNGTAEVHASVFDPGDSRVYILHDPKLPQPGGSVAAAPPPPDTGPKLIWPPPHGTITIGMTRADLEKLPWRRTGWRHVTDGSRAETYIYSYRSDDPTLVDLTVTVTNGRVVTINGGNE